MYATGLFAHAGRYKIMVGAYNTVGRYCRVSDARGRLRRLVWVWKMSVLAYIVDAQRHVRSFTMFARYGKSQRPQHYRGPEACGGLTVWELTAPTIL